MSIPRATLLSLIDYSGWANRRVIEACAALSEEQLARDLNSSHASILGTLRHMYYAERVWLARLRENVLPAAAGFREPRFFDDIPRDPEFMTLKQRWPELSRDLHAYVEEEPDLDGELRGPDASIPRWKLLLHLVNHASLHRGQIITMQRQLGVQPLNTDLFDHHVFADQQ